VPGGVPPPAGGFGGIPQKFFFPLFSQREPSGISARGEQHVGRANCIPHRGQLLRGDHQQSHDQLQNRQNTRFDAIDARLSALEEDNEDLFARVGVVELRLDSIEKRLDAVEKRLDRVEELLKLVLQALGVPILPELGGEKA
jgi:hypothetical protein